MKNFLRLMVLIIAFLIGSEVFGSSESPADWAPITGNEFNMVAYGKVYLPGIDFSVGGYVLYSFGLQGERDCRSKSEIGSDGSYYATILGNEEGEIITFKLFDSNDGRVYELQDVLVFQPDKTITDFEIR